MITGCIMKPPVMMEWIPSGIILGLRMGVAEENLVVSMAKEAGIKNIYKSYINAQNKLDAYPFDVPGICSDCDDRISDREKGG